MNLYNFLLGHLLKNERCVTSPRTRAKGSSLVKNDSYRPRNLHPGDLTRETSADSVIEFCRQTYFTFPTNSGNGADNFDSDSA